MNEKNNNFKGAIKPQLVTEVVFIKVLIIFVIALVPVAFMLFDISRKIGDFISSKKAQETKSIGQEYDFNVQVPVSVTGDISQVPQEKIDSLFSNLK